MASIELVAKIATGRFQGVCSKGKSQAAHRAQQQMNMIIVDFVGMRIFGPC